MVLRIFLLATLIFPFSYFSIAQESLANIDEMQCEYLENPLGIDVSSPRLTWKQSDSRLGARQTAYRILVDTDSMEVAAGKGSSWNTGWTKSGAQLVTYNGTALQPFTKYFWRVDITDRLGKNIQPKRIASFETGMMHPSNWKGSWIYDGRDVQHKSAPYFRKLFSASGKIRSARAYIAAAGLYELYINGEKTGNHRLDPMYTRFDKRLLYVTHDITQQIKEGGNAVGVLLGNGWYNHQSTAVWDFHNAAWRGRPGFCMDIRITYEDGTIETIGTGKDWKTSSGSVTFNSIYTAEHQDARLEQKGWNTPSFNDSAWKPVLFKQAPTANIVSQVLHPIRNVEEIGSHTMKKFNDTLYVFDLGRNISGVSSITLNGPVGTIIRLKHAERLDSNGRADLSNIDVHYRPVDDKDPFQTDIYILSGKGDETFMPHFNYKGFQYVEVTSSRPVELRKESLKGYFMHSDVPVRGTISSSGPLINKLIYATNNSYLSNLLGYPTDCPQREKNGWTGDAHIAIETGLYGFDGITIYEKWLADHRDEQQPNGVLPSIIPTAGWGYEWGNGPDWTSTIAIIPWNIYLFYGDDKLLKDSYENIKRYVDHITDISPGGLTSWGLGDWVPVKSKSPVELTSTAYYYTDALILAKAAELFHKEDDHKKYSALASKIRLAFNEKYFKKDSMIYASGTQTELSVPLFWGLVPDEYKKGVAANLAKRVAKDNFHLDVGLLGQKAILNALSENGYPDIAYRVATQKTYPSWGWWIVNGATTLYENWDIHAKNDLSMNHIMFGEIGAWLYKGLGGIRPDSASPGFKNILINPYFPEDLKQFKSSVNTPFGRAESGWKRKGKEIIYTVVVPPNSTAVLNLNAENAKKISRNKKSISPGNLSLTAGTHEFLIRQ